MNPREILKKRTGLMGDRIGKPDYKQDAVLTDAVKNTGRTEAHGGRSAVIPCLQGGHSVYTGLMQKHDRAHPRFLG